MPMSRAVTGLVKVRLGVGWMEITVPKLVSLNIVSNADHSRNYQTISEEEEIHS